MKHLIEHLTLLVISFALFSCSSDPQWADPEGHEKTEQLQKQYGPLIVGSWHFEHVTDKQRFFERLTFKEDGVLTGYRQWHERSLTTIDGEQRYTDWKDVESMVGSFSGRWQLQWIRNANGVGENRIVLYAEFDDVRNEMIPYNTSTLFDLSADASVLRFRNFWYQPSEGWTDYLRGYAEPGF